MGEAKTPKSLVTACDVVNYHDVRYNNEKVENGKIIVSKVLPPDDEDENAFIIPFDENEEDDFIWSDISKYIPKQLDVSQEIGAIVREGSEDDGWMNQAEVGNILKKRIPGFDSRNYGYLKLREFVKSMEEFEVKVIPNTKNTSLKIVMIRLK